MALQHSTGQRNGALDGTKPVGNPTYNAGYLSFVSTTFAPDAAAGGWLGNQALASPAFGAPVGGVLTLAATTPGSFGATGTCVQAYLCQANEDGSATTTRARILGTVSAPGGGGDTIVSSTAFVANGQITITSLTYTHT